MWVALSYDLGSWTEEEREEESTLTPAVTSLCFLTRDLVTSHRKLLPPQLQPLSLPGLP